MITPDEIRKLEEDSAKRGISKLQLMENAGKRVFEVLTEKFELKDKRILIVCYHGNNGGDGFVAARHLCETAEVDVLFVGDEELLKDEAKVNYKRIIHNERIQIVDDETMVDFDDFDIIVDAIFGTGFKGKIDRDILYTIDMINNARGFKVAIDIPTGIDGNSGEKSEKFINADLIITFHDMKSGIADLADKTVVVDIGLR